MENGPAENPDAEGPDSSLCDVCRDMGTNDLRWYVGSEYSLFIHHKDVATLKESTRRGCTMCRFVLGTFADTPEEAPPGQAVGPVLQSAQLENCEEIQRTKQRLSTDAFFPFLHHRHDSLVRVDNLGKSSRGKKTDHIITVPVEGPELKEIKEREYHFEPSVGHEPSESPNKEFYFVRPSTESLSRDRRRQIEEDPHCGFEIMEKGRVILTCKTTLEILPKTIHVSVLGRPHYHEGGQSMNRHDSYQSGFLSWKYGFELAARFGMPPPTIFYDC